MASSLGSHRPRETPEHRLKRPTVKVQGGSKAVKSIAKPAAPERKQPFGQRAKQHLSALVSGRTVEVEAEKLDRYGRRVGKVLMDGRDANQALVVAGLAWPYKRYQREQSDADRLLYALAEDEARARSLGLWRDSAPTAPRDWRDGVR